MRLLQNIRIAVRALRTNALRSLLTMLGIIIGVAAVITMIAVGEGAHNRVAEQIQTLGANLLMVLPGAARDGGVRLEIGSRNTLTEEDARAIFQEISAVKAASPSVRGPAQIVYGNRNWRTTVNGTVPEYFVVREWAVTNGRSFNDREVTSGAKVTVIGASVARALFESSDPLGRIIRIAGVPVTVVGVLDEKGTSGSGRDQDDVIFVPISTAKLRLIGGAREVNRDAVGYILVKAENADSITRVEQEATALLRQRHRLRSDQSNDFRVSNPAAVMAAQQGATRTMTFLLAAVASVSLIVGGISIMNIMLVSVTERTREIGLRLAVGARRSDIRNQFLVEAIALCVVGSVIGILLGVGTAIIVAEFAGWPIFIGPGAIAISVCFAAVVGVFFGFYPALKASRLDPIEALRFE